MARYIDTNEFEKRIKPYDTNDPVDKALYNFAHNKMLDTSTADVVERKRGKWIQRSDVPNAYTCSNCYQVIYAKNRKYLAEYHAFCGKCGLDMREETEDAI